MDNKETWRNSTRGRVGINVFDRKGVLEQKLIRPDGTIQVTINERLLNMDMAANKELDVFSNGMLTPVRLIDTAEDIEQIRTNPNLKTETDLRDMFKLQWRNFEKEVATIQNLTVLLRLKEIASEGDATVRQVNVIESKIADVDPAASIPDTTIANYSPTVSHKI